MRVEHQLRAFEQIFKSYDGALPLHRFLFAYFKRNKQMGSSDRRWASRYIYSFFRLGKALIKEERALRLAIADFLCNQSSSLVIELLLPELKQHVGLSVPEKLELIKSNYPAFELTDVFSFHEALSESVMKQEFLSSFFRQPDLFIRVKGGQLKKITEVLSKEGIIAEEIGDNTLAVANGTKLDQVLMGQQHYQVQDLSSQQTGSFFQPQAWDKWWDCCAASGGKSLLLHDLEPNIELLVSDVRENSLNNLDERFREAGLKKYQKKVLDLLQNNDQDLHHYEFDGIILDAPCSGSGTWGRTPEMLYYFDQHKIGYFSKLQQGIAKNVVKYLKEGKPLIYITCSVFKQENEDVIAYLLENLPLKLERMELIKGYTHKADTMFVARLIKTN
ncbi:MAG: RsmB/NOP family class I SAM-dependent RNA methyltransferase [Candidatus Pedobacter colombiensis]|uniref:RsmB/NOP family class I SAM-dependent RNA methyltransferase n=1 Tax=Candidatus Pedobacter colombiensis TaxID=3121371 RepID=A0AAJ5WB21_9SPHI|nr:RsmB/NOP family class I SAM-dependent RNA methyltransferase [Pedobacter sp.]WEK20144.1 MAG: RsmB/NOP family class I SAM-dependent RNA methyltransferase [Pedobacter sp.]